MSGSTGEHICLDCGVRLLVFPSAALESKITRSRCGVCERFHAEQMLRLKQFLSGRISKQLDPRRVYIEKLPFGIADEYPIS